MREILFRGKRLSDGVVVEGFYLFKTDPLLGIKRHFILAQLNNANGILNSECAWFEVDPATVGQYTGLQDKNGTKIFEGDIVRFKRINAVGWTTERTGQVLFDFSGIPTFFVLATTGDAWEFYDVEEIEIIGNIHDNPELLEVQNG